MFIRNQAKGIVACDFCVAVTATFRILYVFVVIEHASRRLIHVNVTSHPTAEWVMQQFREAIPADPPYRILIHDRDSIFSTQVDQSVRHMRLRVIKTPVRTTRGECDLRARHWHDAERMFGLRDSDKRASCIRHFERMGQSLQ
jgi:hypothetical protein